MSLKTNSFSLLGALVALGLTGCGVGAADVDPGSDPQAQGGQELLNAPVDSRDRWSVGVCAGALNTDATKGPLGACLEKGTRCTGSLIAPDLVLTARHCVNPIDYSQATGFCDGKFLDQPLSTTPGAAVRITTSLSTIVGKPEWREVEKILTPANDRSCPGDLAILKLKRRVPWTAATPVRVDLRNLVTTAPKEVAVVGRGVIDETFDINTYEVLSSTEGGLKRRVLEHIPFVCVSDVAGKCVGADIGAPFQVDPGYFQIGQGTLSGDSGSGIVRQWWFERDRPLIIGVNSSGTVDPVTGKPNFGYATRLDKHRAFIKATILASEPNSDAIVE